MRASASETPQIWRAPINFSNSRLAMVSIKCFTVLARRSTKASDCGSTDVEIPLFLWDSSVDVMSIAKHVRGETLRWIDVRLCRSSQVRPPIFPRHKSYPDVYPLWPILSKPSSSQLAIASARADGGSSKALIWACVSSTIRLPVAA